MRRKRFNNPFRAPSYRRAMDAIDDEFYAEKARARREAEAASIPTAGGHEEIDQGKSVISHVNSVTEE